MDSDPLGSQFLNDLAEALVARAAVPLAIFTNAAAPTRGALFKLITAGKVILSADPIVTKKRTKRYRLDLDLCLGESLFDGRVLGVVERLLRSEAAWWTSDLCIWREDQKNRRKDIKDFARDVQDVATARGALYEYLVKQHGAGDERRFGTVELRGATNALIVVLGLDDYRFSPSAGEWLWGNTLSLQLSGSRIKGEAAAAFARRFAARACAALSPWYAHAHLSEEWDQKNMSRAGGSLMAMGVDASRYLPGLYWLNFFGEPYCTLIGKERLLNAPAHEIEALDAGVLLLLGSDPAAWDTPEYKTAESRAVSHLGDKYFFNPREPRRETVAPDFGLQPLPRHPRFT